MTTDEIDLEPLIETATPWTGSRDELGRYIPGIEEIYARAGRIVGRPLECLRIRRRCRSRHGTDNLARDCPQVLRRSIA